MEIRLLSRRSGSYPVRQAPVCKTNSYHVRQAVSGRPDAALGRTLSQLMDIAEACLLGDAFRLSEPDLRERSLSYEIGA